MTPRPRRPQAAGLRIPVAAHVDQVQDYLTDLQHRSVLMRYAIAPCTDVDRGDKLMCAFEALLIENEQALERAAAVLQRLRPRTTAGAR